MASESGGNLGRYWAVTGGLVAAVVGVAFYRPLPPILSARFSPADIHSEYVKYLSLRGESELRLARYLNENWLPESDEKLKDSKLADAERQKILKTLALAA